MTSDRQPADRPQPERLALGAASRLLGVDPDTLRRWADEGRVPAFTTPGGHRRFERKALERLMAARRTGPEHGLASLGSNADRLSAAYRRRYSEQHGTAMDLRTRVPAADRDSFRDIGRQLVAALVRHLDETGQARALAEREAIDLAARLGERLALYNVSLADGVSMTSTSPASNCTRSASISAFSANDAPVSRWHQRQWQQCTISGRVVIR